MKKVPYWLSMLLLLPTLPYGIAETLSTDYPFLWGVQTTCRVSHSPAIGVYSFAYTFTNDAANRGDIWKIIIDISRDAQSLALDTIGLSFDRSYIQRRFQRDYSTRGAGVVPTSAAKLPSGSWDATITINLTMSISVLDNRPKPSESVTDIQLTSKGLPSIRKLIIKPWLDPYAYFPAIDDTTEPPMTLEQEDSIRQEVNYYGWILAPSAPPANFNSTTWCDTLLSHSLRSRSLNWITNQTIADKYTSFFTTARSQLQSGNTAGAHATLETALQNVSQDSASTLTSEAYALLRFNTEYLIGQLGTGGPPAPPSLSTPANGATGVSTSPTLAWNASSGATSYHLQVSTSSGFGTTVVNQSLITTTSYAVGSLSGNTTYYWHVNATNDSGTSAYSTTFSFTTAKGDTGGMNMLINPGFESGDNCWNWFTNGDGSFTVSTPGYAGSSAAKISITQAGTNVQLNQHPLTLDPNTLYQLTFAAKCNTGHDVDVSLFQNGAPYTNYGLEGHTFNLTNSWSAYSVEFTTSNFSTTVNDARLMFWLAPYATSTTDTRLRFWFVDLAENGDT